MSTTTMYAPAIADALENNEEVTLDELRVLAHQAEAILTAQGDLAGWLEKLKEEIERREEAGEQ